MNGAANAFEWRYYLGIPEVLRSGARSGSLTIASLLRLSPAALCWNEWAFIVLIQTGLAREQGKGAGSQLDHSTLFPAQSATAVTSSSTVQPRSVALRRWLPFALLGPLTLRLGRRCYP